MYLQPIVYSSLPSILYMGDLHNICMTASKDSIYVDSELSDVRTHTLIRSDNDLDESLYHIGKTTRAARLTLFGKHKLFKVKQDKSNLRLQR